MNQVKQKILFLTSEIAPFNATYQLADFSKKFSTLVNDSEEFDIRISQPKYGFISERKYILREVIRLKDMAIEFDDKERLMNIKSAFIPETRVQVYFLQDEEYFKPLPQLLYKAKNGRILSDNDVRFALFAKVALETLKKLYWKPDIIVCNDWQMSFVPQLLKENYSQDEFYKDIKTVFLMHSLNDYRNFSKKSYDLIKLNYDSKNKIIDNYHSAMEHSDKTIIIDNEKNDIYKKIKSDKIFKKTNHSEFILSKDASTTDWLKLINDIDSILHKI